MAASWEAKYHLPLYIGAFHSMKALVIIMIRNGRQFPFEERWICYGDMGEEF